MSSVQSRTLTITYNNVQSYFSATSGMTIHGNMWGVDTLFQTKSSTKQYATLNNAGKNILYPNTIAHPIKADFYGIFGQAVSGIGTDSSSGELLFNGVAVATGTRPSIGLTEVSFTGNTNSAILSSTKDTSIQFSAKMNKGIQTCGWAGTENTIITLYFTRYDFSATAGTGINSATVSSSTGYDGDTITFNCTVTNGFVFDGWYNGTTKVSGSQSYSVTVNGADMALTAKTAAMPPKNVIVRYNGTSIHSTTTTGDVEILYNGEDIALISGTGSKTLQCAGMIMRGNVEVVGKMLTCEKKIMSGNVVVEVS